MSDKLENIAGNSVAERPQSALALAPQQGPLKPWQRVVKKLVDVICSFLALIILSPLLLFIAIATKLSSKGPVLYSQQRVGYKGRTFMIYKFRSMIWNAEKNGPMLSSDNDSRVTKWGRIMRRWRFDELPQLMNVLMGEMSLVGPRPERRYYIDRIIQQHPEYELLLKVKPGITSLGMVKFGYAQNVSEMISRMYFDLEYLKNISLTLDLKIMIQTVKIIFLRQGK